MNEVLALKDEILALVSESATAKDFEKLNMYLQIPPMPLQSAHLYRK